MIFASRPYTQTCETDITHFTVLWTGQGVVCFLCAPRTATEDNKFYDFASSSIILNRPILPCGPGKVWCAWRNTATEDNKFYDFASSSIIVNRPILPYPVKLVYVPLRSQGDSVGDLELDPSLESWPEKEK